MGRGFNRCEVVGVVANVRHEGFGGGVQPEYFVDLRLSGLVTSIRPFFVVRTHRAPSELLPIIRSVLRQLDPQTGVAANVAAMVDIVSESVSGPRFNTAMLTAFAALAPLLAAITVYGVMAYAVTQRRRALDPITFVAAPFVFSAVAALASYTPAYRATRVDPTVALRAE